MHISRAVPAPEYIRLPIAVLDAFQTGRIGKGELATAVQLYRYLWGNQRPLEGSTAEFCSVLELPERTIQRHLVNLSSTGALECRRPQFGYWVLNAPSGRPTPPELAAPVVVLNHERDLDPDPKKQQQHNPSDPPKLADSGALAGLLGAGIERAIAIELAARHPVDRIQAVIAAAERSSRENPAGWIRAALENGWTLAERSSGRRRARTGADYIGGKYADLIQR